MRNRSRLIAWGKRALSDFLAVHPFRLDLEQPEEDLAGWAARRLPRASYRLGRTAAGRTTIWLLRDVVVDGLPCARGSRLEVDRGRVVAATLAREITIGGLVLAAGHPFRLLEGRLVAGVLARPAVIDGVVCAADKIALSPRGELAWERRDHAADRGGGPCGP